MSARVCEHCGTSNNDSRVYCMDCGSRLPEAGKVEGNSPDEESSGSAGVSAPPLPTASYRTSIRHSQIRQAPVRRISFSAEILLLAILGFLAACLIQAARTPDTIVPAVAADEQAAAKTFANLEKCATSPTLMTWTLNLSAINQFLATGVPQPEPAAAARRPGFRAFATLDFGSLDFFIEKKILGRTIYFSVQAVPVTSKGFLQARIKSGSVGRLPVPAFLIPLIRPQFEPALKNFAPAIELAAKAQSIAINPTDVTLQWPGTGTASP